jgi:imidazolonepropionase-like amidohydrolase
MRTVLHGGAVFDGTGAGLANADVAIEGDVIVGVGPGLDGDQGIDVSGLTILPGLIDAHIHACFSGLDLMKVVQEPFSYQFYAAARNLARTLDSGVTTVRDAGGADLGIKQAAEEGLLDGPDLVIAITVLGQTGGHTDGWTVHGDCLRLLVSHPGRPEMVVDGVEQMRLRVRELARAGADVIKLCTSGAALTPRDDPPHAQFSPDELELCVAEAAASGLGVMAHAQGTPGIKNALRAGVRSIEHGIFLDDECIELLLERDAWLVPTLLAPQALLRAVDAGAQLPAAVVEKARAVVEVHAESVGRAIEAGVKIAMGTDSGVFEHGINTDELELMRAAGLTPAQSLVAATSEAAALLGLGDRIGRVAEGMRADLVVVSGDPFDFPTHRERVRQVLKRGAVVRE